MQSVDIQESPKTIEKVETNTDLSVIIAVRDPDRAASMRSLYVDYEQQLNKADLAHEFIFVVEGNHPAVEKELQALADEFSNVRVLIFSKWYGDATVLAAGFDFASGDILLTLPAYHQIDPESIPTIVSALGDNDMVVVERSPRVDGALTQFQVRVFHGILHRILGFDFHDLGCSVRIFRKNVAETVDFYGDQHRFLPVLAKYYGFKVKEVAAPQTKHDTFQRHVSLNLYTNRLLDLLSIFFLTRFTRKPLRFFGSTGLFVGGSGFLLTLYLTWRRLFMDVPLADKPILLLGVLLIVVGTLFIALGLIGEMIIFTNAKEMREYSVERVIE